MLVSRYAQRWNIESRLGEAVKFFNLNALSSPILVKAPFDVVLPMIADPRHCLLAHGLRGLDGCDASRIFRRFVRGEGQITVDKDEVAVRFPKQARNPGVGSIDWTNLRGRVR